MEIYVNISLIFIFSVFFWSLNHELIIYIDFTRIAASKTASDNVNGAGTNLKVRGHPSGEKRRKFFLVVPSTFLALKVKLVVLVSAFLMVSTV